MQDASSRYLTSNMQTAMARAKKQALASKTGGGSQLKQNASAMSKACAICKQAFHVTAKRPQLEEHVDSKHKKNTFKDCFPDFE